MESSNSRVYNFDELFGVWCNWQHSPEKGLVSVQIRLHRVRVVIKKTFSLTSKTLSGTPFWDWLKDEGVESLPEINRCLRETGITAGRAVPALLVRI